MKGISFAEPSTFTAISRRPFEGLSLNFTYNTLCALPAKGVSWLAVGQKWKALYRENDVPHSSVLAFIRGIMLTLNYYHIGYSAYKRCELGWNGPIIRGTK